MNTPSIQSFLELLDFKYNPLVILADKILLIIHELKASEKDHSQLINHLWDMKEDLMDRHDMENTQEKKKIFEEHKLEVINILSQLHFNR